MDHVRDATVTHTNVIGAVATPILAPATRLIAVLMAALAVMFTVVAPAAADRDDEISMDAIYDGVDDYGRWFEHPRYGEVWAPDNVDDDWRPYTVGRWAQDDENGWTWVSDEPFGWVVYHYGRWGYDEDLGWFWVPGQRWAPAWVAWRESDDHIGWAPLPPGPDRGYDGPVYDRTDIYDDIRYEPIWVFSTYDAFAGPSLHLHVVPWYRNRDYWAYMRPASTLVIVNRRYVNRGIGWDFIRRRARRPVTIVRVSITNNYALRSTRSTTVVNVFRPARGYRPARVIQRNQIRRVTIADRRANVTQRRLNRTDRRLDRRENREDRQDARQDRREERRENRGERQEDRQDARQDRREERREDRQELREDRRDNRQDAREDRRDNRQDRREERQDVRQGNTDPRSQRQDARQDAREERREQRQDTREERREQRGDQRGERRDNRQDRGEERRDARHDQRQGARDNRQDNREENRQQRAQDQRRQELEAAARAKARQQQQQQQQNRP
ncbi:MAG: DUF6600 domain-containing protein [Hyphomicrobiaceae bacterium]|nr:DUF6600 domain-containing protein [Hyphomicrobiaceae bacterium]